MSELPIEVQSLIDIQENPFVLIGPDYRILAANQAYCDAYGVNRKGIVGMRCYEVSHHSPVPCHLNGEHCPHQQVITSGQSQQVLHTHYDRSNRAEHVRIKGYPIRTSSGRLCVGELISRIAHSADIDCEEIRMVGRSPAFLACVDNLTRVAESEASILLYGESGVGKELAAQYIHKRSARKDRPYLAVNCASIPEGLFETELFGHEKGAFTGSVGSKQGLFELANGGTLFLDEVGEIPLSMQAKLLRVLETGEFRRVGGKPTLRADVRIIAATNRDLLEMVDRGAFRQDLYYRIAGIDITLPPLRERRLDIPALAEMFLRRIGEDAKRSYRLTQEAIDKLVLYDFPGNVRELRNILQKGAVLSEDGVLTPDLLSLENHGSARCVPAMMSIKGPDERAGTISEMEATHIAELLQRYNGHRRTVADVLGISERTLYRKLNQYGLHAIAGGRR
jgi:transcriptional regulator with PAS, ATPase and Fis domain